MQVWSITDWFFLLWSDFWLRLHFNRGWNFEAACWGVPYPWTVRHLRVPSEKCGNRRRRHVTWSLHQVALWDGSSRWDLRERWVYAKPLKSQPLLAIVTWAYTRSPLLRRWKPRGQAKSNNHYPKRWCPLNIPCRIRLSKLPTLTWIGLNWWITHQNFYFTTHN